MTTVQTFERHAIVQAVLDRLQGQTYVEIGVGAGDGFSRINAKRKMAVDPAPGAAVHTMVQRVTFRSWWRNSLCAVVKPQPPRQLVETELFDMTSDEFFVHHADLFAMRKIDVAFIDGLHTYQQSLRDAFNCLEHLSPSGVIIMHDCNPPSESAAVPAPSFDAAVQLNVPGWTGDWCGDVWKTIVYLRSTRADLQVFVLDCDFGVGVIRTANAKTMLEYTEYDAARLSYQDLHRDRARLLNLQPADYVERFLAELADASNGYGVSPNGERGTVAG